MTSSIIIKINASDEIHIFTHSHQINGVEKLVGASLCKKSTMHVKIWKISLDLVE